MGFFSGAKAQLGGQRALRTHISANQLADGGKREAAKAKYAEAYRLYEQAMKDGAAAPNVFQGFTVLLLRLGEFDKAHDLMQRMRGLKNLTEGDWYDLRFNYSVYLWRTGRLDEAIETLERAGRTRKNGAYYTTLGMYLVDRARRTGDFAALEALNAVALDYADEDAGALDNMGGMHEAKMEAALAAGDADGAAEHRAKAKVYYRKAHDARPRQITTIYALARLCHEDGEDREARELLAGTGDLYYGALCPVTEEMMEALKKQVG